MRARLNNRYNRPVDKSGPRRDVFRGICVRRRSVPAGFAHELGPALAVSFLAVATRRARPGGVVRIYESYDHTGKFRFVLDEPPELVVSPLAVPRTLRPSNRRPLTEVPQVFEGYGSAGLFGFLDYGLRDHVVNVALKALLLAGRFLQTPKGRAATSPLKLTPMEFVASAGFLYRFSGVDLSI